MAGLNFVPAFRLPEPYKATCHVHRLAPDFDRYRLELSPDSDPEAPPGVPRGFINDGFSFTKPVFTADSPQPPAHSSNSAWARARMSPFVSASWREDRPAVAQVWAMVYAVFSLKPVLETFRLELSGDGRDSLGYELQGTGLATVHPPPLDTPTLPEPVPEEYKRHLIVSRATFWQGAGSPFGPRPAWLVDGQRLRAQDGQNSSYYPLPGLQYTLTSGFPYSAVHARHPIRPPKPKPGSTIYSRYIRPLGETFSMVALDWTDEEHVNYFHKWQNEPRVAEGWNQTGSLEEHRGYLRKVHEDPHQFTVLGLFDGTPFAYFEIYWAKEDHVGVYYDSQDYDRGRHYLVGDQRFRGPHRVQAWHSCLTHYMFLDEPRTNFVVGEPKAARKTPVMYDEMYGYHVEKTIDLPHKRAALVKCSRERFFQLMPFEKTTVFL